MQDSDILNQDTTVSAQWQSAEPDVTHGRVNGYLTMSIDCETDLDEASNYFFEWHITDAKQPQRESAWAASFL